MLQSLIYIYTHYILYIYICIWLYVYIYICIYIYTFLILANIDFSTRLIEYWTCILCVPMTSGLYLLGWWSQLFISRNRVSEWHTFLIDAVSPHFSGVITVDAPFKKGLNCHILSRQNYEPKDSIPLWCVFPSHIIAYCHVCMFYTSSTAQRGGGSFRIGNL